MKSWTACLSERGEGGAVSAAVVSAVCASCSFAEVAAGLGSLCCSSGLGATGFSEGGAAPAADSGAACFSAEELVAAGTPPKKLPVGSLCWSWLLRRSFGGVLLLDGLGSLKPLPSLGEYSWSARGVDVLGPVKSRKDCLPERGEGGAEPSADSSAACFSAEELVSAGTPPKKLPVGLLCWSWLLRRSFGEVLLLDGLGSLRPLPSPRGPCAVAVASLGKCSSSARCVDVLGPVKSSKACLPERGEGGAETAADSGAVCFSAEELVAAGTAPKKLPVGLLCWSWLLRRSFGGVLLLDGLGSLGPLPSPRGPCAVAVASLGKCSSSARCVDVLGPVKSRKACLPERGEGGAEPAPDSGAAWVSAKELVSAGTPAKKLPVGLLFWSWLLRRSFGGVLLFFAGSGSLRPLPSPRGPCAVAVASLGKCSWSARCVDVLGPAKSRKACLPERGEGSAEPAPDSGAACFSAEELVSAGTPPKKLPVGLLCWSWLLRRSFGGVLLLDGLGSLRPLPSPRGPCAVAVASLGKCSSSARCVDVLGPVKSRKACLPERGEGSAEPAPDSGAACFSAEELVSAGTPPKKLPVGLLCWSWLLRRSFGEVLLLDGLGSLRPLPSPRGPCAVAVASLGKCSWSARCVDVLGPVKSRKACLPERGEGSAETAPDSGAAWFSAKELVSAGTPAKKLPVGLLCWSWLLRRSFGGVLLLDGLGSLRPLPSPRGPCAVAVASLGKCSWSARCVDVLGPVKSRKACLPERGEGGAEPAPDSGTGCFCADASLAPRNALAVGGLCSVLPFGRCLGGVLLLDGWGNARGRLLPAEPSFLFAGETPWLLSSAFSTSGTMSKHDNLVH